MKFNKNDKIIIVNTGDIWENKKGIILSDFKVTDETEYYVVKVFFTDNKTVIQEFNRKNLQLEDIIEKLNEDIKKDAIDFIHDYVYLEDIDNHIIHSWFFVDKLAAAEDIADTDVINTAKDFGYKLFIIKQNHYQKILVAAPKCNIDIIYEDYGNYLLGPVEIRELEVKGE